MQKKRIIAESDNDSSDKNDPGAQETSGLFISVFPRLVIYNYKDYIIMKIYTINITIL